MKKYKHSEEFYQRKFHEYNLLRDEIEQQMWSEGLDMYNKTPRTYEEFKVEYDKKIDSFKNDQANGYYKYTPNAVKDLIRDEQYPIGRKEALGYWRLLREQEGDNFTKDVHSLADFQKVFSQMRAGKRESIRKMIDWTEVDKAYHDLKTMGYSHTEAKHMISQAYFGSR